MTLLLKQDVLPCFIFAWWADVGIGPTFGARKQGGTLLLQVFLDSDSKGNTHVDDQDAPHPGSLSRDGL